jgi:hypothetical protein
MTSLRPRLAGLAGAIAIVAGVLISSPSLAVAKSSYPAYTCWGSSAPGTSIPGGIYSKLTVYGVCNVDDGTVNVGGNVDIKANSELVVAFSGNNLNVGKNITIGHGGVLILGCEPYAFDCFDTQTGPTPLKPSFTRPSTTVPEGPNASGWVGGSLDADQALAVIVHNSRIGHNVENEGGGGGATCNFGAPTKLVAELVLPFGPYVDYEDNWIGGNVKIEHVATCWSGFVRNWVGGDVNFNYNVVGDPDGNEVGDNWIGDDLNCRRNDVAPHLVTDSSPSQDMPNTVIDHATGQCASLTGVI